MKKIALLVLIPLVLNTAAAFAAISDVNIVGGTADRRFDESRTLYYITPENRNIVPRVTAVGGEVIKEALDFDENRVTVIADTQTGAEYRFVTVKLAAPKIDAEKSGVNLKGEMTLFGEFPYPCEVMLLRPKAEDKNVSYTLSDVKQSGNEDIIFDFAKITDQNEFKYLFPSGAPSGMFRVVIGGANVGAENQTEFECYYASYDEMDNVLRRINSIKTADELKSCVIENRLLFKTDKSEIESFSDFSVIAGLVLNKGFTDITAASNALNEGIAVTRVNRAENGGIAAAITENKDILGTVFDSCFENVKDKSALEGLMYPSKCKNASEVQILLNKASAVQTINEADFSNIKGRFFDNFDKFGFTAEQEKKINSLSEKQTELMLTKLVNRSYKSTSGFTDDVSGIVSSIMSANEGSGNKAPGGGGGGGVPGGTKTAYTPDSASKEPDNLIKKTEDNSAFSDLDGVPWAKQAILYLHDIDVLNGRSEKIFAPDELITREEFVKIIIAALGIETEKKDIVFTDVPKDAWFYPYITAAAGEGIISGKDDGTFGAGEFITREDMAVIIKKACDYRKITITEKYQRVFEDEAEVSDYAKSAVRSLFFGGIVNGTGNNKFSPKEAATRAMSAKIVYSMLKDF